MNALWARVSWAHRPYIEIDAATVASACIPVTRRCRLVVDGV